MVRAEYTEEHEVPMVSPPSGRPPPTTSPWCGRSGSTVVVAGQPVPPECQYPARRHELRPDHRWRVLLHVLPPDLHLCFECHVRPACWYAQHYYGAMLCAVCCERYDIDFRNGELRQEAQLESNRRYLAFTALYVFFDLGGRPIAQVVALWFAKIVFTTVSSRDLWFSSSATLLPLSARC